jgi:hypothetical protein
MLSKDLDGLVVGNRIAPLCLGLVDIDLSLSG